MRAKALRYNIRRDIIKCRALCVFISRGLLFRTRKHVIKSGERKNQEKRWESVGFLIPWAYGGGQRETRKGQDETEERYQIVTYGVGRVWIDSEEWGWLRMYG